MGIAEDLEKATREQTLEFLRMSRKRSRTIPSKKDKANCPRRQRKRNKGQGSLEQP